VGERSSALPLILNPRPLRPESTVDRCTDTAWSSGRLGRLEPSKSGWAMGRNGVLTMRGGQMTPRTGLETRGPFHPAPNCTAHVQEYGWSEGLNYCVTRSLCITWKRRECEVDYNSVCSWNAPLNVQRGGTEPWCVAPQPSHRRGETKLFPSCFQLDCRDVWFREASNTGACDGHGHGGAEKQAKAGLRGA
jgi:hypothetical protein